jgi:hypothetical protein
MSHFCRNWREDSDDNGHSYEYCKGKRSRCTCSGVLPQCDYPLYFNAPEHRFSAIRSMEAVERGVAYAEPFRGR